MKTRFLQLFLIIFLWVFGANAATNGYAIDETKLAPTKRSLYVEARETLNGWSGQYEALTTAGAMIDSFIKSDPNFLPIYIEKARLLIMTGYSGQNDHVKFNKRALEVLGDIQKKEPTYATPYVLAGHIYTNLNDFENAWKSLVQANKLTTSDPWLYLNWSELYGRTNQYGKAVEFAYKGLLLAKQNTKALASAIYAISKYSPGVSPQNAVQSVATLVFNSFGDPLTRLKLADSLVASYDGSSEVLTYANEIILRQKKETPSLPEANISMAELYLKSGYQVTRNEIDQYDFTKSSFAERILASIVPTSTTKDRIFSDRFSIAVSNGDVKKAIELLDQAEMTGIQSNKLQESRAVLLWLKKDYAGVIKIYEDLVKRDPTYESASMLGKAYSYSGRVDKKIAMNRIKAERDPTNAWALGNYAQSLLFDADDSDGAIEYGNRAIREMPYQLVRNTTSLAYLIKASKHDENGDRVKANEYFNLAVSIGIDPKYVSSHCWKYCSSIDKFLKDRPLDNPKVNINKSS